MWFIDSVDECFPIQVRVQIKNHCFDRTVHSNIPSIWIIDQCNDDHCYSAECVYDVRDDTVKPPLVEQGSNHMSSSSR